MAMPDRMPVQRSTFAAGDAAGLPASPGPAHPPDQPGSTARFRLAGRDCMVVPDRAALPDGWEALASFVADGGHYLVLWGPAPADDRLDQLTPRELEIAVLVADGRDAKAIARHLRISFHTVREHLSRIYGKLGLHKQTELATCVTAHFAGSLGRSSGPAK